MFCAIRYQTPVERRIKYFKYCFEMCVLFIISAIGASVFVMCVQSNPLISLSTDRKNVMKLELDVDKVIGFILNAVTHIKNPFGAMTKDILCTFGVKKLNFPFTFMKEYCYQILTVSISFPWS